MKLFFIDLCEGSRLRKFPANPKYWLVWYLLRWAKMPLKIVDGVVGTLTFGFVQPDFSVMVGEKLLRHGASYQRLKCRR